MSAAGADAILRAGWRGWCAPVVSGGELVKDAYPDEQRRGSAVPCDEHDLARTGHVVRGIDAGESRLGLVNNLPGTPAVL
jgi:hypothetical protein